MSGLALPRRRLRRPPFLDLRASLCLAYLVVMGSIVAFMAFMWLVKVQPPAIVSTYTYINPVVAVFAGWIPGFHVTPQYVAPATTVPTTTPGRPFSLAIAVNVGSDTPNCAAPLDTAAKVLSSPPPLMNFTRSPSFSKNPRSCAMYSGR